MKLSLLTPLIAALLLLAPALCAGQKIQKVLGSYQASGSIPVSDTSQSVAFLKVLKWLASGDTHGNYLLEGSDTDALTLKCSGGWGMSLFMNSGTVRHTLRLRAAKGAVEYVFGSFVFESLNSGQTRFEGPMAGRKGAIAKTEKEIALTVDQLARWLSQK